MNRINNLFSNKHNDILSIYFTAGFPQLDSTCRVIESLAAAGVDMVEVGIPFSDPMADGPVIQNSSTVALNNGMTLSLLFDQLEQVRSHGITIPLVLMGYLNPIMQYGIENFCRRAREVGVDGVIIPDLPLDEYITNYKPIVDRYGLKFVMLITPATSEQRVRLIDSHTDSFIYMVSTAATTGAQDNFSEQTIAYFDRINNMKLRNPRLIGFGISNSQTLGAAFTYASGAIIGSRFVSLLGNSSTIDEAVKEIVGLRK